MNYDKKRGLELASWHMKEPIKSRVEKYSSCANDIRHQSTSRPEIAIIASLDLGREVCSRTSPRPTSILEDEGGWMHLRPQLENLILIQRGLPKGG